MGVYKSRRRWLAERWVAGKQAELGARWDALREQLLPASWPRRMQRVAELSEGETVSWQPRAGSSQGFLCAFLGTSGAQVFLCTFHLFYPAFRGFPPMPGFFMCVPGAEKLVF